MRTSCPTILSLPLVGGNRECRVTVTHLKQFCGTQQGAVELATTGAFLFPQSLMAAVWLFPLSPDK
jgi:hypothetical protein